MLLELACFFDLNKVYLPTYHLHLSRQYHHRWDGYHPKQTVHSHQHSGPIGTIPGYHRSLNEGKNIRHYERGRNVNTNTGPAGFRQIEYINNTPYLELYSSVNWEIIGFDSGWFEQAFSSKYRVVRILSNICDSSVVGDDRTNVLGEAKVDAVMAEGQQYYEPTHLRNVRLRERELDVIEIIFDDLNGSVVDLGIATTSVVLHFKRRGDIKS